MVEGVARFISGAKMDDVLLSRVDGDWVWKREEGGEMSGDEDAGLHREMGRTGEEEADLCRVWLRSGTGDVETCGWLDRRERGKELDYPRGRCRVAHRVSANIRFQLAHYRRDSSAARRHNFPTPCSVTRDV